MVGDSGKATANNAHASASRFTVRTVLLSFILIMSAGLLFVNKGMLQDILAAPSSRSFSFEQVKEAWGHFHNLSITVHTGENATSTYSVKNLFGTIADNAQSMQEKVAKGLASLHQGSVPASSRRKPSRRVISYSVYGSKPMYLRGMVQNARLAKVVYPGWEVWVYHDLADKALLAELRGHGAKLIDMKGSPLPKMQWRFLPMNDPDVERFISRDSDSRLTRREKHAVDEWVQSGKPFHTMRDHEQHGIFFLGGMFGIAKKPASFNVEKEILKFSTSNAKQVDQQFLNGPFRRQIKIEEVLQHDAFLCLRFPGSVGFPTQRNGTDHVGSIHTTEFGPHETSVAGQVAPIQCRRDPSWIHGR